MKAMVIAVASAVGAVMVFPIFWLVSSSLKARGQIFALPVALIPHPVHMQSYAEVVQTVPILHWTWVTAVVSVAATGLALAVDSAAGYALARLRFPLRNHVFAFAVATMVVTQPVIIVPLFAMVRAFGLLNTYWGLILPSAFSGFGIFLMRQFMLSLPADLEDAAVIDGCSRLRTFWHIILPLTKPAVAALGVILFQANWNAFLWPIIAVTSPSLTMLQPGIATFAGEFSTRWDLVSAASVLASVPVVALFFVFQRHIVENIKIAGMKG